MIVNLGIDLNQGIKFYSGIKIFKIKKDSNRSVEKVTEFNRHINNYITNLVIRSFLSELYYNKVFELCNYNPRLFEAA